MEEKPSRKDQRIKYQIYDSSAGLFDDYPEMEAKTSRKALEKFLASTGRGNIIFKRSGDRIVHFKTTPFTTMNGQKRRTGKDCWWKIISK